MPTTREIDPTGRFVRATWTGDVTQADVEARVIEIFGHPILSEIGRSLTDIRGAQLMVNGADINAATVGTIIPMLGNRRWRTAYLVAGSFQYGMCRQFIAYTEQYIVSAIFTDEAEAIAWLVSDA